MKTSFLKLIAVIACAWFALANMSAQEITTGADSLYLIENGSVSYATAVAKIDSMVFFRPAVISAQIDNDGRFSTNEDVTGKIMSEKEPLTHVIISKEDGTVVETITTFTSGSVSEDAETAGLYNVALSGLEVGSYTLQAISQTGKSSVQFVVVTPAVITIELDKSNGIFAFGKSVTGKITSADEELMAVFLSQKDGTPIDTITSFTSGSVVRERKRIITPSGQKMYINTDVYAISLPDDMETGNYTLTAISHTGESTAEFEIAIPATITGTLDNNGTFILGNNATGIITSTQEVLTEVIVSKDGTPIDTITEFTSDPIVKETKTQTIAGTTGRDKVLNLATGRYIVNLPISEEGTYTLQVKSRTGECTAAFEVIAEYVEINGVKWSTRNVAQAGTFTAAPETFGMFYQWNRKTGWAATGNITGWDASVPTGDAWAIENDPSPSGYHVPTHDEIKTLFDTLNVTAEWTAKNGVTGYKFTDNATQKSIFLPAAGHREREAGMLRDSGTDGPYWSSTPYNASSDTTYYLNFFSDRVEISKQNRSLAFSIRPVKTTGIIIQLDKEGTFYSGDVVTGKIISAEALTTVTVSKILSTEVVETITSFDSGSVEKLNITGRNDVYGVTLSGLGRDSYTIKAISETGEASARFDIKVKISRE
jgi:uncharacterized protein (TIGR02145 family)